MKPLIPLILILALAGCKAAVIAKQDSLAGTADALSQSQALNHQAIATLKPAIAQTTGEAHLRVQSATETLVVQDTHIVDGMNDNAKTAKQVVELQKTIDAQTAELARWWSPRQRKAWAWFVGISVGLLVGYVALGVYGGWAGGAISQFIVRNLPLAGWIASLRQKINGVQSVLVPSSGQSALIPTSPTA